MKYETVKYNNQSEALAAFKKMVERKRQWISDTEREFENLALFRRTSPSL